VSKPIEVEELVDRYIHRPLAARLVSLLVCTPITPNQVTLLSSSLGVLSAIALVRGIDRPLWRLGAAGLLFLSVVLDCCDGQLARARGISSTTGAILDGISDYVVGAAVGVGATWFMIEYYHNPWAVLLGLVGSLSVAVQSALFEHNKTRYIARVGGGYSEREEDIGKLVQARAAARAEGRWRDAFLFWIYETYSRAQHSALRIAPVNDPVLYRSRNAGRMRAWAFLGIGTHFALAYVAMAVGVIQPLAFPVYMIICATVLNVFLVALMALEPRRVGE
jgi:phosphatidylglycerophosphate synthase